MNLGKFENRLDELFSIIRDLNGDAIIIVAGLYNPFSIVTDETNEFEDIIADWNEAIEVRAMHGRKVMLCPCYRPVRFKYEHGVPHRFLSSECKGV